MPGLARSDARAVGAGTADKVCCTSRQRAARDEMVWFARVVRADPPVRHGASGREAELPRAAPVRAACTSAGAPVDQECGGADRASIRTADPPAASRARRHTRRRRCSCQMLPAVSSAEIPRCAFVGVRGGSSRPRLKIEPETISFGPGVRPRRSSGRMQTNIPGAKSADRIILSAPNNASNTRRAGLGVVGPSSGSVGRMPAGRTGGWAECQRRRSVRSRSRTASGSLPEGPRVRAASMVRARDAASAA